MFTFRKIGYEEFNQKAGHEIGGFKVYDIGAGEEKYALFFGQLRKLFGEPNDISEDWETMYRYLIEAEDEQGNKFYLEAYHGPRGASIGYPIHGVNKELYEQAKKELIALIEAQIPADYVWESVYEDIPSRVTYIVKDGQIKVEDEILDFES